jgi:hypothetical protein
MSRDKSSVERLIHEIREGKQRGRSWGCFYSAESIAYIIVLARTPSVVPES